MTAITHISSRRPLTGLAAAILSVLTASIAAARDVSLPPANQQFDYQLGGAYPPASSVVIVIRDRLASPAAGKYNICYVNAFQTQPADAKWWLKNHPDLLVSKNGTYVVDPEWPDEYLLDTSTSKKRDILLSIVGSWIDTCARDGFDAIEADNLDSWTRSQSILNKEANIAFATRLAQRAHAAGLAIAQKNASELAPIGHSKIGFDFAIAEECQIWSECDDYMAVYGARVYEVEYADSQSDANGNPINPIDVYNAACATRGSKISVIYRDREVRPAGSSGYDYKAC
ncbi:MAG: secreted protein [Proteobacteria bacterium]|nr:secreted protein [Pseudomonadota bacterium]